MRPLARSTTARGSPSECWTYMLSSQSRAGNCGHAGRAVKRLKMWSTRPCGSVCGKLPTSEGAAQKRGCCILQLLRSGENHTASTPCVISENRTCCSKAQYNPEPRFLRFQAGARTLRLQQPHTICPRVGERHERQFPGLAGHDAFHDIGLVAAPGAGESDDGAATKPM